MNVARILYPVNVLGPGNRIGIWTVGCSRSCPGCSNPELWEQKPEYEIPVSCLIELINSISDKHQIDGFTISGGEPMLQAGELLELITNLCDISTDVLVYTGFSIEELKASTDPSVKPLLKSIAVLIDGEYVEELNDNSRLRGSSNQRIHILKNQFESKYNDYIVSSSNQIQNFTTTDGIVSVGIHHKGWMPVQGGPNE